MDRRCGLRTRRKANNGKILLIQELPASVKNYLRKFSFTKWKLITATENKFNIIVVIPTMQEKENVKKLLASLLENDPLSLSKILFVFVINNLEISVDEVRADNLSLLQDLKNIVEGKPEDVLGNNLLEKKCNIAYVDASSTGFEMPEKDGGVGYARKIGMDLALSYFDYESLQNNTLVCLDADCIVSQNYAHTLSKINNYKISAGYIEYEHLLPEDNREKTAIIIYEIFLRYYVLGLKYSNSPFSFDTIGSTMFCNVDSYVKIGGMNKKKAAEDFYFLEKLAKITKITKVNEAKVFPSSRGSWRVPFGTGQRVNRFFAGTHDEYSLYDPISFEILSKWHEVFFDENIRSADEYLLAASNIDSTLKNYLLDQSFVEAWTKIVNETSQKVQLQKQKYFWFDGFRTLKLIHYLRDSKYSVVNIYEALDQLFEKYSIEVKKNNFIHDWQNEYEYLKLLRTLNNS